MKSQIRSYFPVEAFMTPGDVRERLRVNSRTVYRLLGEGQLPAVRIGRQWRVHPSDFDLWLRRHSTTPGVTAEPEGAGSTAGQHGGIAATTRPSTEPGT